MLPRTHVPPQPLEGHIVRRRAKQTAKEHHVPEHEDEHQHGNPQFALKVLLILIAIILVIVILKATGVPFAVKDWLSHVTGDMIALR